LCWSHFEEFFYQAYRHPEPGQEKLGTNNSLLCISTRHCRLACNLMHEYYKLEFVKQMPDPTCRQAVKFGMTLPNIYHCRLDKTAPTVILSLTKER
jgi:hypothetical protein